MTAITAPVLAALAALAFAAPPAKTADTPVLDIPPAAQPAEPAVETPKVDDVKPAPPTGDDREPNAAVYRVADELYEKRSAEGAPERARALLENALKTSPLDAGLLWRYGRARVVTGERHKGWGRGEDFVAAEEALRSALDIDPAIVDAHYWLAMAHFRRSRYPEALDEINAALALAPNDARLYHLSGDIRWRAPRRTVGDRATAIRHYEKAVELAGNQASYFLSLAEAYSESGREQDAAAVLDRMGRISPAESADPLDSQRLDRLRRVIRK